MSPRTKLILVLIPALIAAVGFWLEGGGVLPSNVDSPFPADGWYLLAAHESQDNGAVAVASKAESLRKVAELEIRTLDYDKVPPEPWHAALKHAESKSGGQPYYVARHGRKAVEGPLTGDAKAMLATLSQAVEATK